MLVAKDLFVTIGKTVLLRDISLTVLPGQILAVIGSNGAGKSTLLHTLAGQISPTTGQVIMNGYAMSHWSLRQRATLRAVLSQTTVLTFPFSVTEVVNMGITQYSADKQQEYACHILEQVGISHLAQRCYTTLSGGEKQQVQFARVLAQIWAVATPVQPRYLLLDELTASLDLAHQHHLLTLLQDVAQSQSLGIFIISHDINLAAQYAHRIACLKKGRLVAIGTPDEVLIPACIQEIFAVETTKVMVNQKAFFVTTSVPMGEKLPI